MDMSSELVFTTERLRVRRWRDDDLAMLMVVYGDPEGMRWVGDGQPLAREGCVRWLEVTRANYARRGYGMFAVEALATSEVLGFCGIVHPGDQPEAEVKYAYARAHWGGGIATEALRGLIAHGHRVFGLTRMIATAAPANEASHRVLLKAGMQRGPLRDNGDGSFTQLFEWLAPGVAVNASWP